MQMFGQEEDEKERLSQAKEASEDDGTEHAEATEDSLLGFSIEEVFLQYYLNSIFLNLWFNIKKWLQSKALNNNNVDNI